MSGYFNPWQLFHPFKNKTGGEKNLLGKVISLFEVSETMRHEATELILLHIYITILNTFST